VIAGDITAGVGMEYWYC